MTTDSWNASIDLLYRCVDGRTRLSRRHSGPLQVQKALYPEGPGRCCHTVLLHPPGGIAGGDRLRIDARAEAGAHALITTPGATRWYKADGHPASQQVRLQVEGALEWLPQEAIVFDAAEVRSELRIEVAAGSRALGWDIVALGRTASGERFEHGSFVQTIRLFDGAALQWLERTRLAGCDALLESPIGLDGCPVFGCFWAHGPAWSDAQLEALRIDRPDAALTRMTSRLLLGRTLGRTTMTVRAALESLWRAVRPLVFDGLPAAPPRIWAT
jgi:urease accessory protein